MLDFFFFLLLEAAVMGIGEAAVLRPGMMWTGDGRTKVSILKLLTAEYPELLY